MREFIVTKPDGSTIRVSMQQLSAPRTAPKQRPLRSALGEHLASLRQFAAQQLQMSRAVADLVEAMKQRDEQETAAVCEALTREMNRS
jgi:hypothetical protein